MHIHRRRFPSAVAALTSCVLVACSDDKIAGGPSTDAGASTGAQLDASGDAPPSDAGTPVAALACTGGAPLAITGNYVDTSGVQHWLRRTASANTYSRIPAGAPDNASPPILWNITQVCSDSRFFVATSGRGTYARVDWIESAEGVELCIAVEGATDAASVLAVPLSVAGSATGCKGNAWTVISKTDGGL